MSNEMVPATETQDVLGALVAMPDGKFADNSAFNQVSSSGYLPRIALMNATSQLVQQDKAKSGHYVLQQTSTDGEDLTKEVNVIPVKWRPKAMDLSDKKKIISAFNHKSEEFKRIAAKAEIPNSNCMFGPEFLVWVPSVGRWATFFMASKTARRAAADFKDRLEKRQNITLKATFIKSGSNSWWGPVIVTCSLPLDGPTDMDEAKEVIEKFTNPPDSETEAGGEEAPAEATARPR